MTIQYEHMTLVIQGGKVVKVDKPQNSGGSFWNSIKAGVFEPLPGSLVDKTVAFALDQLSTQKWEVIHLPPGSSQPSDVSNAFPAWPGLPFTPAPTPKADSYEILLRREIRK